MKITGDWTRRAETQAVFAALGEAYFVGGCVRDALAARPVGDIDIATPHRPPEVMARAAAAGLRAIPTGVEHGTVTVVSDGVPHEVTTFRRDVETDGRRARVAFSDRIAEDAARRDFTMNALYATAGGAVLDPLGCGLDDLLAQRVRFVGAPEDRIREDHLRILRFFRFRAWYGSPAEGPDPEALAAIAAGAEGVDALSGERVGAEMRRFLAAPDPAPAAASMALAGVLGRVLPGGDARPLALLVALEAEAEVPPAWHRRLACIGGGTERLRLSRAEARALGELAAALERDAGAPELGYRFGADAAGAALLIRAARSGVRPAPGDLSAARAAAARTFPVTAADLMPDRQGPALGAHLRALEDRWIASGFTLDRQALLDG